MPVPMVIEVLHDLHVRRAPGDRPTPWLVGGGPRWELIEPFVVLIDDDGEVAIHTVPKGYIFDGSSIPRYFWWLYPPSYPPAWRGACLHDRGLSHWFRCRPQDYWDRALKAMILHDGGRSKDANRFHWAVSRRSRGGYKGVVNLR